MKRLWHAMAAASAVACLAGTALAQATAAGAPVSREEFDKVMKELTDLRQEVANLKKQRADDAADAEDRTAEIERIMKDVMKQARANAQGEEKLLITGDADAGFSTAKGWPNTFSAGVAPRFLWKFNDQILFDAAFDVGVDRSDGGDNETTFDLMIASVTYAVCDYAVVGAGLFVTPFAAYHRDFDPPWITKLPDDPLVFSDPKALAPESVLGVFVSGAYPVGPTKVNYAVYFSNGPELHTGPDDAGSLSFDNYGDLNNNKAYGFRFGFLPIPELEIGYSLMYGQASARGDPHANALLQAVDFNYTRSSERYGLIALRAEWVWSDVTDVAYEALGGLSFDNNRNGGYVQVSYRPTQASTKELRNVEGVFRYDRVEGPSAAPVGAGSEDRYTIGLNYWFDARTVLKVAYEFDHVSIGDSAPGFMMQFGLGF